MRCQYDTFGGVSRRLAATMSVGELLLRAAASLERGDSRFGAMVDAYYCLVQLRGILMTCRGVLELQKSSCWSSTSLTNSFTKIAGSGKTSWYAF